MASLTDYVIPRGLGNAVHSHRASIRALENEFQALVAYLGHLQVHAVGTVRDSYSLGGSVRREVGVPVNSAGFAYLANVN